MFAIEVTLVVRVYVGSAMVLVIDDFVEIMPNTISQILEAAHRKRQREHTGSKRNRALQIQC